jgi:copper chaperone
MREVFRIGGMGCISCVEAVTRAIRRLDAQAAVSVDLAQGEISIDAALPRDRLRQAVEAAGFTVAG